MLKGFLLEKYIVKKQSVACIAKDLKCSQNKINYWLAKHNIQKRTISDAIYQLRNPLGDPFCLQRPRTLQGAILYGMGLGLYWGEGLKRGKGGLRLGNTDVRLIRKFIEFLETSFGINKTRLRFGVQIFNDISPASALSYWMRELKVERHQFYKVIVSKIRGRGTYRYKSEYGVLMVYFNNTRLKELICKLIDNIS
jgi:hypothetical protein